LLSIEGNAPQKLEKELKDPFYTQNSSRWAFGVGCRVDRVELGLMVGGKEERTGLLKSGVRAVGRTLATDLVYTASGWCSATTPTTTPTTTTTPTSTTATSTPTTTAACFDGRSADLVFLIDRSPSIQKDAAGGGNCKIKDQIRAVLRGVVGQLPTSIMAGSTRIAAIAVDASAHVVMNFSNTGSMDALELLETMNDFSLEPESGPTLLHRAFVLSRTALYPGRERDIDGRVESPPQASQYVEVVFTDGDSLHVADIKSELLKEEHTRSTRIIVNIGQHDATSSSVLRVLNNVPANEISSVNLRCGANTVSKVVTAVVELLSKNQILCGDATTTATSTQTTTPTTTPCTTVDDADAFAALTIDLGYGSRTCSSMARVDFCMPGSTHGVTLKLLTLCAKSCGLCHPLPTTSSTRTTTTTATATTTTTTTTLPPIILNILLSDVEDVVPCSSADHAALGSELQTALMKRGLAAKTILWIKEVCFMDQAELRLAVKSEMVSGLIAMFIGSGMSLVSTAGGGTVHQLSIGVSSSSTTTTTTTTTTVCGDAAEHVANCQGYVDRGFCDDDVAGEWMRDNCGGSCGYCLCQHNSLTSCSDSAKYCMECSVHTCSWHHRGCSMMLLDALRLLY
jgi:hypothetical protein